MLDHIVRRLARLVMSGPAAWWAAIAIATPVVVTVGALAVTALAIAALLRVWVAIVRRGYPRREG